MAMPGECNTRYDMFDSSPGGQYVPHGHIHPDFLALTGKILKITYHQAGILKTFESGKIVSNAIVPSRGDMSSADRMGKSEGTLRNVIVTGTGVTFYNGNTWFSLPRSTFKHENINILFTNPNLFV